MYWGRKLESVVAEEFSARTKKTVRSSKYMYQSVEHPFMLADVDRVVVGENAGLECKTASAYLAKSWDTDCLPDEYMLQVQHYMCVMGWDRMYVACLVGGQQFKWVTVERSDALIQSLVEAERHFWNYVETDTVPPLGTAADVDAVFGPLCDSDYVPASESDYALAKRYLAARAEADRAKAEMDSVRDQLVVRIGEHRGIEGLCEYKTVKGSTDWQSLAKSLVSETELKALAQKFARGESRRFSMKVKEITR